MMMKKYFVFLDDGENSYKIAVPAENEKKAREFCEGNGEVIAVKEVSSEIPADKVREALKNSDLTAFERDFIYRTLYLTGIIEA